MATNKAIQGTKKARTRKSVPLTTEEKALLRKFAKQFTNQEDIADALGITRGAYIRIAELGRGSEQYITIIREKLNTAA